MPASGRQATLAAFEAIDRCPGITYADERCQRALLPGCDYCAQHRRVFLRRIVEILSN